jgi:methyl-accepting chemotaxis protein
MPPNRRKRKMRRRPDFCPSYNLASQTAKATEEIGAQVSQIQTSTQDAVNAIRGIASTIAEVSAIATSIASAVEEQGAATAEIARNVQQTARAAQDVTVNIADVRQTVATTNAAADQVLKAATGLTKEAEELTVQLSGRIQSFVADVRAA